MMFSMGSNLILVSVCMLTFNHEKYIKQAIEGVLMQQTDFEFELIICDDASPDRTREIIDDILLHNPKSPKIRYIRHEKNIVMYANGEYALKQVLGKYIAICEGDDYWTDANKLSIQVKILEENNDIGLVHHDANYFYEKTKVELKSFHKSKNIKIHKKDIFSDLIKNNKIFTLTVLYRKELLDYYYNLEKDFVSNALMNDYIMWLEFSQHCNFYYIDKSMATYRVLEESASRSMSYEKEITFLKSYCMIKRHFINKYISHLYLSDFIDQYEYSTSIMLSIKYKKDQIALEFSKLLKPDKLNMFVKKYLVKFPSIFRLVLKFI